MAVGNTFGATALSSYGGFWLAFAIILTPGGFQIESSIEESQNAAAFRNSFGFFLMVCAEPTNFLTAMTRSLIGPLTGLVHLHIPPLTRHPPLDRGFLHPVLHARYGLLAPSYCIPTPQCYR